MGYIYSMEIITIPPFGVINNGFADEKIIIIKIF